MKPKYIAEIKEDIVDAGLQLIDIQKHRHLRILVKAADGRETTVIASISPSDRRARLNRRSLFRRFALGSQT